MYTIHLDNWLMFVLAVNMYSPQFMYTRIINYNISIKGCYQYVNYFILVHFNVYYFILVQFNAYYFILVLLWDKPFC